MMIIRIEVPISELQKQVYSFTILSDYSDKVDIRLSTYQELSRENTRKRIWNVDRWYDWYNHRDRYKDNFIPANDIIVPEYIQKEVVKEFISRIIFTKGT